MNRRCLAPFISVFIYLGIYLLVVLLKPPEYDSIRELVESTKGVL
jgi:hypothetical protein